MAADDAGASDRDLRAFAQMLSQICWRTTPTGEIDYFNPAWYDYTGLDEATSRGTAWMKSIHPDDLPGVWSAWSVAARGETPYDIEFRIRSRAGVYRWFIARATPLRNADGTIGHFFGTCIDIDEKKRVEDQFRAIAEAIPQMVWTARADGALDYLNARIYEYAGGAHGDLTGWSWERAIHPDDLQDVLAVWKRALRQGGVWEVECRLLRHDGAYRWFMIRASSVRDPQTGAIARWFGTCTDIDDLRTAAARDAFLSRADALFAAELDPDAILQTVARSAVSSFCDYCLFDRLDDDGTLRRAAVDHRDPLRREPFAHSVGEVPPLDHPVHPIAVAWRSGQSVLIPRTDAKWWRSAAADEKHFTRMRDEGLSSLMTVLVTVRERRYGALTFCRSRGSQPFTRGDVATVEDLARRIGAALENARLYAEARAAVETQRRIAEREALYARLGEAFSESLDLRETLDAAASLLVPTFADWVAVNLIDEDGMLYLAASEHRDPHVTARMHDMLGMRYLAADARAGPPEAVRTRRTLLYETLADGELPAVSRPHREELRALELASATVVPLVSAGAARGTITVAFARSSQRRYTANDVPFFEEIARRLTPAITNAEAYERERRVARTFQAAALTTHLPRLAGTSFDALYEAGRSEALIGGDWYDAFRIPDGRIVVSIGDVAGSGLEAAATMAVIRQSLRGAAAINPDPSIMLDAADRVLRSQSPERFVTAWVGVLDPVWSTLTCAGAGHPAPLRRTADGTIAELHAGGLPLGLRERGADVTQNCDIEPGTTLVLYTDGLIESSRDVFEGDAALRAALREADVEAAPARSIHQSVLGTAGASDDVAMLVIAYRRSLLAVGPEGGARAWRIDSHDAAVAAATRAQIAALLASHGLGSDDCVTAELVFAELVGNVARYAAGAIDVALDLGGDEAVLHVVDRGSGFQHNARLPSDALAESGRGLFIVSAITDEFSVTRRAGGGAHARAVLKGRLRRRRTEARTLLAPLA